MLMKSGKVNNIANLLLRKPELSKVRVIVKYFENRYYMVNLSVNIKRMQELIKIKSLFLLILKQINQSPELMDSLSRS